MKRTYAEQSALTSAASADALAYFADAATIERTIAALERREFAAWDATTQDNAAGELRAYLAQGYGPEMDGQAPTDLGDAIELEREDQRKAIEQTQRAGMLASLTDDELNRELAHARNRRDAFGAYKDAPPSVLREIREVMDEQARRRASRRRCIESESDSRSIEEEFDPYGRCQ